MYCDNLRCDVCDEIPRIFGLNVEYNKRSERVAVCNGCLKFLPDGDIGKKEIKKAKQALAATTQKESE